MNSKALAEIILVVDDSESVRETLVMLLGKAGYVVEQAAGGAEAIEATRTKAPDLILLDIRMPDMDGTEVCRRLKEAEATREIPVMFLSGLRETEDKTQAFEAGGVDFLTKPFEIQEVLARVRTHLALRRAQANLKKLNRELEQRVDERTKDLSGANRRLQDEIAARKQAEGELSQLNASLEQRVRDRTGELENARQSALSMMQEADRSRRKAEDALKKLAASAHRLKRLEQTRDSLTYMIVHDLRSPLGAVRMAIELLQSPAFNLGRRGTEILDEAYRACTTLIEMVTRLLDVNRLEANQMPLRKTKCDLVKAARNALDLVAPLLGDRRVALDGPTGLIAQCDESLLSRILGNLLGNALKFTPAGGEIKIAVSGRDAEARIVVSDTGPGIPREYHRRVFEKYFQIEDGRGSRGTGLGLTFCKLAVEAHGGRIGVADDIGTGCSFWFTLPLESER
jgi:signal transduction histidine kinase